MDEVVLSQLPFDGGRAGGRFIGVLSSGRRHTRCSRDWSSDVCSSDLVDALNQITGTTEKYSSEIPEPFTFIPAEQRSIALADGSITSSFLEMLGRRPRATGLESERNT